MAGYNIDRDLGGTEVLDISHSQLFLIEQCFTLLHRFLSRSQEVMYLPSGKQTCMSLLACAPERVLNSFHPHPIAQPDLGDPLCEGNGHADPQLQGLCHSDMGLPNLPVQPKAASHLLCQSCSSPSRASGRICLGRQLHLRTLSAKERRKTAHDLRPAHTTTSVNEGEGQLLSGGDNFSHEEKQAREGQSHESRKHTVSLNEGDWTSANTMEINESCTARVCQRPYS